MSHVAEVDDGFSGLEFRSHARHLFMLDRQMFAAHTPCDLTSPAGLQRAEP